MNNGQIKMFSKPNKPIVDLCSFQLNNAFIIMADEVASYYSNSTSIQMTKDNDKNETLQR